MTLFEDIRSILNKYLFFVNCLFIFSSREYFISLGSCIGFIHINFQRIHRLFQWNILIIKQQVFSFHQDRRFDGENFFVRFGVEKKGLI